ENLQRADHRREAHRARGARRGERSRLEEPLRSALRVARDPRRVRAEELPGKLPPRPFSEPRCRADDESRRIPTVGRRQLRAIVKSRSSSHGPFVAAATITSTASIATLVISRATRDALFLSIFEVARLPGIMIAAATASLV